MAKLTLITALALALFLAAMPASAEFYKYRDANGVLRFTDNLAEVPPDQRPNVSTYEGVQASGDASAEQAAALPSDEGQREAAAAGGSGSGVKEDLGEERKRLEGIKQTLDKEREDLALQKEALKEERKRLRDERDARVYNEKVKELNDRIAEYEQRRKAFQEQADGLNSRKE
jgi:hypothetical protein